jgi:hypothetical protein
MVNVGIALLTLRIARINRLHDDNLIITFDKSRLFDEGQSPP